jgi:hypothetical protein
MGMGYMGYVQLYRTPPASDGVVLLTTGSSLNLVLEPIYSTSVWGAGWYNAASTAHYADSAIRYEGGIDFELQMGQNSNTWEMIREWGIDERAFSKSADISPDGRYVYEYRRATPGYTYGKDGLWCRGLSFSTSEGSFVTCSADTVGLTRATTTTGSVYYKQVEGIIGSDCTVFGSTNPLNPGGRSADPIAFWKTKANIYRGTYPGAFTDPASMDPFQAGGEVIEWSCDLSNNTLVLYTCNGDREATAVLQGSIDATASVTFYNEDGVYDPILGPGTGYSLTNPYLFAEESWFQIEILNVDGAGNNVYIELPAIVVESDDYGIKGQSDVTSRGFSIKGLGGRCDGNTLLPPMLMSSATGTYVPPIVVP